VRALDLSIAIEEENLRLGSMIRVAVDTAPRGGDLILMRTAADAAYGTGLLNERERGALQKSFDALSVPEVPLRTYMAELRYLGLVPGWARSSFAFTSRGDGKLAEIEPRAELFVQDQLRGSPLLFYSQVLDALNRDANRLAGVRNTVFGKEISSGFMR